MTTALKLLVHIFGLGAAFYITIERSETVSDLKDAIVRKCTKGLEGVDAYELILYKIEIPYVKHAEDAARQASRGVPELELVDKLSEIFPVDPPQKTINIAVDVPDRQGKRKRDEEEYGLPLSIKMLKKEIGMRAPSSIAAPSEFRKITGKGHIVGANCPFEFDTIPLVLLHEAFAAFKDRCKLKPSERAVACLQELVIHVCEWFDEEITRVEGFRMILEKHMHLRLVRHKIQGKYTTDGNLDFDIIPAAIRECKNEYGHGFNQAVAYYGWFLIKAYDDPLFFYNHNTRFPSILIVDSGPYLGFYGAIWDGTRMRIEPLTPTFDLTVHWEETDDMHAIASALDALVVAVDNIETHYKSIFDDAVENPTSSKHNALLRNAREYPFMTSYEDDDGQRVTFTYNSRLDDQNLVFSAIPEQPGAQEFIVKFTRRYSQDTHKYLASNGLAPRLRGCVRISDNWTAVIMDRSEYRVLYDLRLSNANKEKVRHKVERMVRMLHQEGFVHGDIRDTNILIDVGSLASEEVAIHLIDLDWAGRIGEARYPIGVNKLTVKRPARVQSHGLIATEDDLEMVSFLFTFA